MAYLANYEKGGRRDSAAMFDIEVSRLNMSTPPKWPRKAGDRAVCSVRFSQQYLSVNVNDNVPAI